MPLEDIQREISEYWDVGWRIEETDHGFYDSVLCSPRGFRYPVHKLQLNICTICEEGEECSGMHVNEDVDEEGLAKKISHLIRDLPHPQLDHLPEK
jgi:hypothetical protein